MAIFSMKTKDEPFTARVHMHIGLRSDLLRESDMTSKPENVPPWAHFDGKPLPFLAITTPKGKLELRPGEVEALRQAIERFRAGEVRIGAAQSFDLDLKLTDIENDVVKAARK